VSCLRAAGSGRKEFSSMLARSHLFRAMSHLGQRLPLANSELLACGSGLSIEPACRKAQGECCGVIRSPSSTVARNDNFPHSIFAKRLECCRRSVEPITALHQIDSDVARIVGRQGRRRAPSLGSDPGASVFVAIYENGAPGAAGREVLAAALKSRAMAGRPTTHD
jgi:hypothetical protein